MCNPQQFNADSFETVHEDVHMVWIYFSDYFYHFFRKFSVFIGIKVYRQWIPYESNFSYYFTFFKTISHLNRNLDMGHEFSEFACCTIDSKGSMDGEACN